MDSMQTFRHAFPAVFLALTLSVAVFGGTLFHAAVPHHHDHDEDGAVWTTLHAALRHDKMGLLMPPALPFVFPLVALFFLSVIAPRLLQPFTLEYLLSRGVLAHRKFG